MHLKPQKHVASLLNAKPYYDTKLGSLRRIVGEDLPILKNLSIKKLILAPNAMREPHWHANCNELSYCLRGKLLISMLDIGNSFSSFIVTPGQMFFIKTGALHHIENIGEEEAEVIIAFRHEAPLDFSLSGSFGAFSDAVLGNTYDVKADKFANIPRDTTTKYIVERKEKAEIPSTANLPNPAKFDLGAARNGVSFDIGSATQAKSQYWPVLNDIAMYSLVVEEDGMREPHWHPFTAEMGYVHKGKARMTVMDPDGSLDTYTLGPGDVYFIPAAYPHQIEVIAEEEIQFLIFFDAPMPGDVGFRTAATALSREVLASAFEVPMSQLPQFPFTTTDPLIVGRVNPVDAVKEEQETASKQG